MTLTIDWVLKVWFGFVLLAMGTSTAVEVSAIRQKINGANGLFLFMAIVACGVGSVAMVVITGLRQDAMAAIQAAAAAALLGLVCVSLSFGWINRTIKRAKG